MKRFTLVIIFLITGGSLFAGSITDGILPHYFAIRTALAGDTLEGVAGNAAAISAEAGHAMKAGVGKTEVAQILADLKAAAKDLEGKKIGAVRESFKTFSRLMVRLVEAVPSSRGSVTFYCPMAKASWIQEDKRTGNPYYGGKMLKCGKVIRSNGAVGHSGTEEMGHEHHHNRS